MASTRKKTSSRSKAAKKKLHKRYIFGSNILLHEEFEFAADIKIRPINFNPSIEELARYTTTQVDYGFFCAVAETLTFELEITGSSDEEVAKKAWNCQWLFVLLSVVLRAPVNHHIESAKPHSKMTSQCCWVQAYFLSASSINYETECTLAHLIRVKELARDFMFLNDKAFTNAAAIAANNFNEPRKTIRMASIWAGIEGLIGVSHELTYRIPLICSLILKEKEDERLNFFKDVQNLYGIRSKCVHGDDFKAHELEKGLEQSLELLCQLVEWTCEQGEVLTAQKAKELPIRLARQHF